MPIVEADWSIDRATRNIRYIGTDHGVGSPSYATVIQFHRFLQDRADDAVSSGDDQLDITDLTPSDRSTDNIITLINGYNIDDASSEHLFDGSIIQGSGATEVIYDGIVNFGNTPNIQILQNGTVLADDWWNNDTEGTNLGLNSDAAAGISHRFMVKVRDAGIDIDGRRLLGTSRNFGKTYSEFSINGSSRGNNVLALSESDDLNNQTDLATVAGFNDIVNTNEGYIGTDVSGDGIDEFYYSNWDVNTPTRTINEFYERMKYLTREGSAETLYGLSAEVFRGITHEIDVDGVVGSFVEPEQVSWAGGTGQLLAINDPAAGTKIWIQLLTGVIPTDDQIITGTTSAATANVNVSVIERSISTPFVGASTGSALIGSFGLGVQTDDLLATDTLFDLTNTSISAPNNVTFSVSGLVSLEDYVLVGPETGGTLETSQLSLAADLTTDGITEVTVTTPIPSDTPSSGTIRVQDNDGFFRRIEYSSYAGNIFTVIPSGGQEDFATVSAAASNNVWISYIDKLASATNESFTGVFLSTRPLFIRVRDGGAGKGDTPIRTFETTGSLGPAGGSTTAIRTVDA